MIDLKIEDPFKDEVRRFQMRRSKMIELKIEDPFKELGQAISNEEIKDD